MAKPKRFYNLVVNGATADLDIYGDIRSESYWSKDSDTSAYKLSRQLEELDAGVTQINVNINSYGGEVSEGIAIYNALRRHSAKVVTRCDGMACSIASVIFMAGEERVMYEPSMLMIHNASTGGWGTAAELRKAADDAEKITSMSKAAYMQNVNITEEELTRLMDEETWISPAEALEWGFATEVEGADEESNPTQSVRGAVMRKMQAADADDTDDDQDDDADDTDADDAGSDDQEDITDDEVEVEVDTDDDQDDDDDESEQEADPDDEDGETDDDDEAKQSFRQFITTAFK